MELAGLLRPRRPRRVLLGFLTRRYMSAIAKLLEDGETAGGIEAFSRRSVAHGGLEWTSEDVRAGAGVRLYRATADSHWILAKDGRPDHRIPVPLT